MSSIAANAVPIVLQAAFFGALYQGARTIRRYTRIPIHPSVSPHTELVPYPGLRDTLSQLAQLEDGEMSEIVALVCEIVRLGDTTAPASQSRIAAKTTETMRRVHNMLDRVDVTTSDEVFRRVMLCREECIGLLNEHLDDILHNHILNRSPG